MQTELVFGPGQLTVDLPDDRTVIPSSGVSSPMPKVDDVASEVRRALDEPVDSPPLREVARGASRVAVAFDDPTVQQYAPVWETAIPTVIAELETAGVSREDVELICANALHRKFTHDELATVIGDDLVREFGDRLRCHDAEDPDGLVHLGTTPEHGYHVELNRAVIDSDLTVYVNTGTMRAFSGGWKSICVGLSTYRSIAHHHNPDDMSMSTERNVMHDMLDEMGALVTRELGEGRIFKLETSQANPLQVSRMWSGTIDGCRHELLDFVRSHQKPRRDLVDEKVDVVLYGVPDWSPYAAFSHNNPILTLVSTGLGYLGGVIQAFGKPGCTVILANPVPDRWDERTHPSYREVWDRVLPDTLDPYEARQRYEADFASRPEYVDAYRERNGFHGVHGIMAIFPLKRLKHAGRVIVAGAEDPSVPEHLGFGTSPTVEDAVREAEGIHGPDARIACVRYPPAFNRS